MSVYIIVLVSILLAALLAIYAVRCIYSLKRTIKEYMTLCEYREKLIYDLFRILDDIDLAEEIAGEDHEYFRNRVGVLRKKRYLYIKDKEIEDLYNKFYKK